MPTRSQPAERRAAPDPACVPSGERPTHASDEGWSSPPIVWSIAATDSGGGAGLSADQRAADAFGVHLCPVVAAVTAQHSTAVTRIEPVGLDALDAQLEALAGDMPPAAVKTGVLANAAQVERVAHWIDRLRERHGPVPLVIDPVLAASSGAAFADAHALAALRDVLLPRASLVTPNRREAAVLAGHDADAPALARALRGMGARAVGVTGGDSEPDRPLALDWLATEHAAGWLALPRVATPHHHGTGCTFATSAAAALALGFVATDALVLAKMATHFALRHGHAAGRGAGPVVARPGFASGAAQLPRLSFDEVPPLPIPDDRPTHPDRPDLYAIVDSADRVHRVLAAGVRTVQLRIKLPCDTLRLRAEVRASVAACRTAGAMLFVNDHWALAAELGAPGVHLGQEDLQALGANGRAALAASGLALGVSSHSLWELARARSLAPRYIACGPVWPTTTKAMPWQPQGLHNLAWWCHVACTPVVAIGGILSAAQVHEAARCGADGVCLVRVLGDDPAQVIAPLHAALLQGRGAPIGPPALPRPTLARTGA